MWYTPYSPREQTGQSFRQYVWKMPNGHCFEPYVPGVNTDILKGGAGNNHVQST